MNPKIIIGQKEAMWLIANMIVTKISLNFARILAESAGPAGWILSLYILILALIGFFIVSKLFERFPGKDIIDIGNDILGPIGRIIVGTIMLATLLYLNLIYLREFSEHMKVVSFIRSPLSFIMLFYVTGIIIACYFGLEAITRIHSIGIPMLAVLFVIVGAMTLPFWDPSNILPILGLGPKRIFFDSVPNISSYCELVFLFLLPPFLASFKSFKSVGYKSILIAGSALTIFSFAYSMLVPYPSSSEMFLPIYQVTRVIEFGRFIQRLEPLFIMFWSLSALFFLSASTYFTIYTFSKMFKLPYIRPLLFPFIIIIYTLAFIPLSLAQTVYIIVRFFYTYSWISAFLLPILLLILAITFKKGGNQNA